MILGVQILGILFGLFMVYITFIKQKKGEFTFKEAIVWAFIWAGFLAVTFFPRVIAYVAKDIFNLTRPLDFYIIVGFMLMIGINFYTYTIVRKTQKKVDNVVRKITIKNAKEPKKRKR